jgi:hypothetical protein
MKDQWKSNTLKYRNYEIHFKYREETRDWIWEFFVTRTMRISDDRPASSLDRARQRAQEFIDSMEA